jgi:hypothetical protein
VYLKDTHFTNFRCASREIQKSRGKEEKEEIFAARCFSFRSILP